jgi:hypothetical protein
MFIASRSIGGRAAPSKMSSLDSNTTNGSSCTRIAREARLASTAPLRWRIVFVDVMLCE